MHSHTIVPGEGAYYPLDQVNTVAATPSTTSFENIKINVKLPYLRLHHLPEFKKIKGNNKPIALVGGGPSVKNHIEEIKKHKTIICCGSPHDFLIENKITPTYAVICDPDPVSINYFQKLDTEVKYLVASSAHKTLIDHFKESQVVLWHCHSDDYNGKIENIEVDYQAIGGGCTVGLRSICIAMMLGYTNIHFYGFDSCLSEGDISYPYEISTEEEKATMKDVYTIKVGDLSGLKGHEKEFRCYGYQLAQAYHFKQFYQNYGNSFNPTFHGEGLLPELMKMIRQEELQKTGYTTTVLASKFIH